MTRNTLLLSTCLAAFGAIFLSPATLPAQSNPPVPAPTPGAEPLIEKGPTAQITMDDGTAAALRIRGRNARRVLLRPGRRATIALQYDRSWAGIPLGVAALDGGKAIVPGNRSLVDGSGRVVLQFSDAQRPGLYRVALNCGGIISILQFWVPGPDGSAVDASIQLPAATSR